MKKLGGIGAAGASAALLHGCNSKNQTSTDGYTIQESDVPKDAMTYRSNPYTGDKVSILGYGCMRWPTKAVENGEELDQETITELVDYALDHGVNYFDTAPVYGRGLSERATGVALKRHPRDTYYIATKMSTQRLDPTEKTREASIAMYRNSFKELQVDYIDYYLLHAVGIRGGIEAFNARFIDNGVLDFLLEEREAGRIRNLGWSFHGAQEVFDHLLAMDIHWDFAQIQLNYIDWKHASRWNINANYLYEQLTQHQIPAVIMEPLLGGRLATLNHYSTEVFKQELPLESIASWAFRFAGSLPNVLTVLSGMTYKEHLQDNLCTYSPLAPLNDHERSLYEDVVQMILKYPVIACTECDYCMPCPYGLDIPGIFTHYNRCVNDGNIPKSSQDENYRRARRAFLIGYDRSVPKLRQADRCIDCDQCRSKCPQRINIPQEMARIDTFVEHLKQGTEI